MEEEKVKGGWMDASGCPSACVFISIQPTLEMKELHTSIAIFRAGLRPDWAVINSYFKQLEKADLNNLVRALLQGAGARARGGREGRGQGHPHIRTRLKR